MSPYRTASPPKRAEENVRCCGQCHAAVGGCQRFVTWTTAPAFFGLLKRTFPAGASIDRPTGTPPIVWRNGQWHREDEESK